MTAPRIPLLANMLRALAPIDPEAVPYPEAVARWNAFRKANGGKAERVTFLATGEANAKLALSGIPTRSLTLAPWIASALYNACEAATRECRKACVLMTAGRGPIPSVLAGRIMRTAFLGADPAAAVSLIAGELQSAQRSIGGPFLVRLNVASDIPWELIAPAVFDAAPEARFYDYTKLDPIGKRRASDRYRIVYSVSEAAHSIPTALEYVSAGGTAAAVFDTRKGDALPAYWRGFPVVDGDASDDRTADPAGVIVGLRAKGDARKLRAGGFVQASR